MYAMTPSQAKAAEYIDKAQNCEHIAEHAKGDKRKKFEKDAVHWRRMAEIVLKHDKAPVA